MALTFQDRLVQLIRDRTELADALIGGNGGLNPSAVGWFLAYGCRELAAWDILDQKTVKVLRENIFQVPQDQPDCLNNLALLLYRYFHPDRNLDLCNDFNDRQCLYSWFYGLAVLEYELAPFLGSENPAHRAARLLDARFAGPFSPGVNLVGYPFSASGLGEDLRNLWEVLTKQGIPCSVFPLEHWSNDPALYPGLGVCLGDNLPYSMTIFCTNGFECRKFFARYGERAFQGRHTVGLWPWEMPLWPEADRDVFDRVDEVWAISSFVRDMYMAATHIPVRRVPPVVHCNAPSGTPTGSDRFTFLFIFDFASGFERKNPLAAVRAFCKAFPRGNEPVELVLKAVNAGHFQVQQETLQQECQGDDRIRYLFERISPEDMAGLMDACDCYLSLHRSEGFGRTIAEAMAAAKPVIATDWSGSRDLVGPDTGFPVRYSLVPVPEDAYGGSRGCRWAEPCLAHAAEMMRVVAKMPADELRLKGEAARRFMQAHFSVQAAGRVYEKYVGNIIRRRS